MKKGTFWINASSSTEDLADWLEWRALRDKDGSVSLVDLQRELTRTGSTDALASESDPAGIDDPGAERAERLAAEAFAQIKLRQRHCGDAERYPFKVNGACVERTADAESALYTFLLLLSRYGPKKRAKNDVPAGTFEDVSCGAAVGYCGGPSKEIGSFPFGFPRRIAARGFRAAIDELCKATGEGTGHIVRPIAADQKDAKLDLVVWRAFPDARIGKWWAFGQCAAGNDWPDKMTELQPSEFCQLWIAGDVPVKPDRFFFVPHVIEDKEWVRTNMYAGVVFDRCRIVAVSKTIAPQTKAEFGAWSASILQKEVRV